MLIRSLFIVVFCLLITPSVDGQLSHDEKVDTLVPISNKIPKKPWTAAGEIMMMNILINRLDANIRNVYWAKVTPTTWKNNVKVGFQTDWDHFTTNWLGHPVHGSLFFNAARSNGFNYWGSLPFTVGGSLIWEYFGETQYASEIDLFTTTMGGMYVGELTHRLTDLFKRKINNKNKLLKNIAITALNPMGKLNSVLNKNYDGYNNYTPNTDLKYQFMFGSAYSLGKIGDDIKGFKGFANVSMIYGDIFNHVSKPYNPFDFFILRTWLDFNINKNRRNLYFNVLSHSPIVIKRINSHSVVSISQHYDFLESYIMRTGALSFTGDYHFNYDWNQKLSIKGSVKGGVIVFGSSKSGIVNYLYSSNDPDFLRDYVYGRGYTQEGEFLIKSPKFGKLVGSINRWVIYPNRDTKGIEDVMLLSTEYHCPVFKNFSLGLQLNYYKRFADYTVFPKFRNIRNEYQEIKSIASWTF